MIIGIGDRVRSSAGDRGSVISIGREFAIYDRIYSYKLYKVMKVNNKYFYDEDLRLDYLSINTYIRILKRSILRPFFKQWYYRNYILSRVSKINIEPTISSFNYKLTNQII